MHWKDQHYHLLLNHQSTAIFFLSFFFPQCTDVTGRSFLPKTSTISVSPSTSTEAVALDVSVTPLPPIYLPTTLSPMSYHTVEVQRKVVCNPPPLPVKDAQVIEMEVCTAMHVHTNVHGKVLMCLLIESTIQQLGQFPQQFSQRSWNPSFYGSLQHTIGRLDDHKVIQQVVSSFQHTHQQYSSLLCPCVWLIMHRPSTYQSLKAIEGVSELWLNQHGSKFLEKIAEFCSSNNLSRDVMPPALQFPEEKLV